MTFPDERLEVLSTCRVSSQIFVLSGGLAMRGVVLAVACMRAAAETHWWQACALVRIRVHEICRRTRYSRLPNTQRDALLCWSSLLAFSC